MEMNRPVFLLGNGLRGNPDFVKELCSWGIPVLTTWMAADLVPEDSPVFCGRPGTLGDRGANIIQQKSNPIYIFGARLDEDQVAYRLDNFAPRAWKFIYDIDRAELEKLSFDTRWVFRIVDLSAKMTFNANPNPTWMKWCKDLYLRFRVEHERGTPYNFVNHLSELCQPDDIIVASSSGFAGVTMLQAFKVKEGQRLICCSTIGAMGIDIPMAIGAAMESGKRTILVTGDGGIQLNIQALETAYQHDLPIKIFVYKNGGYASVRVMQNLRFKGHLVGCDIESGLMLPSLDMVVPAFGIHYYDNANPKNIERSMASPHPSLYELIISRDFSPTPKVMSSSVNGVLMADSMEDMSPKIPDLKELMNE